MHTFDTYINQFIQLCFSNYFGVFTQNDIIN